VKSVVVQAVTKDFRVHVRTPPARMFQFLDDERTATFAHDKSITQRIEWTTGQSWITGPSAHCFDNVERANCNSSQRRFCSARNHDVRKIVSNVTQRFAYGHRSAGATV
jgi:hypothetical protein